MTASVSDGDWVFARYQVEVVDVKRALILDLGVVKEESLDPESARGLPRPRAELVDDAGDGNEFNIVRIPTGFAVKKRVPWCVILCVDEAEHDTVICSASTFWVRGPISQPDLFAASDRNEAIGLYGESFGLRRDRIDGVSPGVENYQIGFLRGNCSESLTPSRLGDDGCGHACTCQAMNSLRSWMDFAIATSFARQVAR